MDEEYQHDRFIQSDDDSSADDGDEDDVYGGSTLQYSLFTETIAEDGESADTSSCEENN